MDSVVMGQHVVIEDNVRIGNNVTIGHNVDIYAGTMIGDNVVIQDNVIIGKQPTRAKASVLPDINNLSITRVVSEVTIGISSIIYNNSTIGNNVYVEELETIREQITIGDYTIIERGVAVEND